jgi:hypothetical protein
MKLIKNIVESIKNYLIPSSYAYDSPFIPHIKNTIRRIKNFLNKAVRKYKLKFSSALDDYKLQSWIVKNFDGATLEYLLKNYDILDTAHFKVLYFDMCRLELDEATCKKWLSENLIKLRTLNQFQVNSIISRYLELADKIKNPEKLYVETTYSNIVCDKFNVPLIMDYYFLNSKVSVDDLEIIQAEVIEVFRTILNNESHLNTILGKILKATYHDYLKLDFINEEILDDIKVNAEITAKLVKLQCDKLNEQIESNISIDSRYRELRRAIAKIINTNNTNNIVYPLEGNTFLGINNVI